MVRLFFPIICITFLLSCSKTDGDTEKQSDIQLDTSALYSCESDAILLFRGETDEYAEFRLPTIIEDGNGVIYVFAEGRHTQSDWGDIDIVMKKSEDGGKTFGEMRVIKNDGENKCGDPTPVYDDVRKRILLIYRWGIAGKTVKGFYRPKNSHDGLKFYVTYSSDGGETWSNDSDISYIVPETVGSFSVGPVHAIQLKHQQCQGRIVVPAYCTKNELYHSLTVYSDDGGKTWNTSNIVTACHSDECTVTELKDGTLLLSQRFNSNKNKDADTTVPYRLRSWSKDFGKTWVNTQKSELIEPKCQASLLTVVNNGNLTDTLLFSNPYSDSIKCNLTLQISTDNGRSWLPFMLVNKKGQYSDLVQLDNNEFGIVYESYNTIKFSRFSINQ